MNRSFFATVFLVPAALVFLLGVSGCERKAAEGGAPARETKAELVADFPAGDGSAWVNGAPASLLAMRGKNVVLVEAWHRL